MPRSKARKAKLSELLISRQRPEATSFLIWDSLQRGLTLRVRPSGARSFYCV